MKETKVYVDELPKSCVGCKYFAEHRRQCELKLGFQWSEEKQKYNDCPLKSLHDHDKELVAKVLEKVSIELENEIGIYCEIRQCNSPHYQGDYAWFNYEKFRNYLNQQIKELKGEL